MTYLGFCLAGITPSCMRGSSARSSRARGEIISHTAPLRTQQSYRHEAFLWREPADFVAGLAPFVIEGLDAGEPVMVATIREHARWLTEALGSRANQVTFVDMAELGRNPARIIPAWQRFLDLHAGENRPLRGIGEPIWAGRRDTEVLECQVHEALLNVAVHPHTPFWLVCPYDTGRLDAAVIEEAYRSHPVIVEGSAYRGSGTYGGSAHVDTMFTAELSELDGEPAEIPFFTGRLKPVFAFVALHTYRLGLPVDQATDLAAAVTRLASSSARRGASTGKVRIWDQSHAVICEVVDDAVIEDRLAGRRKPDPGFYDDALWFANQVCDLVQLRSGPSGTTVRIHTWR
ncbi:MAG: anti-sigma factor RsbA family regulatory protein [Actinomycetes bacterium]